MFEPVTIPHLAPAALTLQAAFHPAAHAAAVIAPPHPVYGGRCDNPIVLAATEGLSQAGVAVLRFNFRGTGGSSGQPTDDAAAADSDYRAATTYLETRQAGPYLAAGYSFGAATALRVAARDPRFARLLLVAPPISMLDLTALRDAHHPVSLIAADDDEYAPLDQLQALVRDLSHVQLHVIAGADHFFSLTGDREIASLSAQAGNQLLRQPPG
jgi:uncharacterized protein